MARRKRPVWTFDCETDPFLSRDEALRRGIPYPRKPHPFLWGLYEGRKEEYHEFRSVEDVLAFFLSEYASTERPIIYAHNGGRFADYHELKYAFNSDERIMIINGRLGKFRIGECEFRDSINILPIALSDFKKDDMDYSIMEEDVRWEPKNYEKISKYMRNDCVYLYEIVEKYQAKYGTGLTQAGASMRYWAKTSKIKKPKQSAAVFERLKPFYYGGRVECFKTGHAEVPFKVVDINSAYPRAMLEKHPFSVQPSRIDYLPSKDDIPQCLIEFEGIADGSLPYRTDDNKLIFPRDDKPRVYQVTGWEYLAALELGALEVKDIRMVFQFAELIDFKDYILDAYAERKAAKAAGNKADDLFSKLRMNGLYGKFASDPLKYREWIIASEDSYFKQGADGYHLYRQWGDERYLMRRSLPRESQRYYNIATAASITGYVRAFLYRSLRACKNPIYCDTDSISAEDVSGLDLGPELGQWKVESECSAYAVAGKKLYAFRDRNAYSPEDGVKKGLELFSGSWWKTACKGGSLTVDEIIRASRGEKVVYWPEVPTYSILHDEPIFTSRIFQKTA